MKHNQFDQNTAALQQLAHTNKHGNLAQAMGMEAISMNYLAPAHPERQIALPQHYRCNQQYCAFINRAAS